MELTCEACGTVIELDFGTGDEECEDAETQVDHEPNPKNDTSSRDLHAFAEASEFEFEVNSFADLVRSKKEGPAADVSFRSMTGGRVVAGQPIRDIKIAKPVKAGVMGTGSHRVNREDFPTQDSVTTDMLDRSRLEADELAKERAALGAAREEAGKLREAIEAEKADLERQREEHSLQIKRIQNEALSAVEKERHFAEEFERKAEALAENGDQKLRAAQERAEQLAKREAEEKARHDALVKEKRHAIKAIKKKIIEVAEHEKKVADEASRKAAEEDRKQGEYEAMLERAADKTRAEVDAAAEEKKKALKAAKIDAAKKEARARLLEKKKDQARKVIAKQKEEEVKRREDAITRAKGEALIRQKEEAEKKRNKAISVGVNQDVDDEIRRMEQEAMDEIGGDR
ncbi:MAG TPA: hypothetical protein DCR55_04475 [Lentisphaeria bacterium]|nr:hypothetical protein [Lentisphaeria bacterium]